MAKDPADKSKRQMIVCIHNMYNWLRYTAVAYHEFLQVNKKKINRLKMDKDCTHMLHTGGEMLCTLSSQKNAK